MATRGMAEYTADGVNYTVNDPNNADEFVKTEPHAKDSYAYHKGNLYRFIEPHSENQDWSDSIVEPVKVGDELKKSVRVDLTQSFTTAQKAKARENIDAASTATATTSANGLMSSDDKTKLNGVEAEANKTLYDTTLSESGQAADAKATGDQLGQLKSALNRVTQDVYDQTIILDTDFHSNSGAVKVFQDIELKSYTYYEFHVSSDNPLTLFSLTNYNAPTNVLEIRDLEGFTDETATFEILTATSKFNVYVTTINNSSANIKLKIIKKNNNGLQNAKENIDAIFKSIDDLESNVLNRKSLINEKNVFIAQGGHTFFSNIVFLEGETYEFRIKNTNVSLTGQSLEVRNVNNSYDKFAIKSGTLDGTPHFITFESNSSGIFIYNSMPNFRADIIVSKVSNYAPGLTLLRKDAFTIPSGQTTIAALKLSNNWAPFLIKNVTYKCKICLTTPVTISNGYIDIFWDKTYDGRNEQGIHITDFSTQLDGFEFEFTAAHAITYIKTTLWLPQALESNVLGKIFVWERKTGLNVDARIEKGISRSYYLASYTRGGSGGDTSGKLRLAVSDDGVNFHRLNENYIFDAASSAFQHDIDIIEKDEYFYITATTSRTENDNAIVQIYRSKNLKDWGIYTELNIPLNSFVFDEGNSFISLWAPEILYLNGQYYLSFAVCEKWTGSSSGSVVKGYIGDLSNDFTTISNINKLTVNTDYESFTFDTTIYYDNDSGYYYAYWHDGGVYRTDSLTGTWTGIASVPLHINGYSYMEGGTIIKDNGWFYLYGDGTKATGQANNMLCWKTKDFTQYELYDKQFDTLIRHPKIIAVDCLAVSLAEKIYIDSKYSN